MKLFAEPRKQFAIMWDAEEKVPGREAILWSSGRTQGAQFAARLLSIFLG